MRNDVFVCPTELNIIYGVVIGVCGNTLMCFLWTTAYVA